MDYLNRIYPVDCQVLMTAMRNSGIKVDTIITSPPYNTSKPKVKASNSSLYSKDCRYDTYDDHKTNEEYVKWSCELFNAFDTVVKENGIVCYNLSYGNYNPDTLWLTVADIIKETPWQVADCIIWKKKAAFPNNTSVNKLTRICEFVFIFVRKSEYYSFYMNKPIKSISRVGQKFYESTLNLIEAANNDEPCPYNNATFSSDLVMQLLNLYCPKDGIVLDPFIGSGTTGKAALLTGRNYMGAEISQKQYAWAIERLKKVVPLCDTRKDDVS